VKGARHEIAATIGNSSRADFHSADRTIQPAKNIADFIQSARNSAGR
jgi:hypothetical protein